MTTVLSTKKSQGAKTLAQLEANGNAWQEQVVAQVNPTLRVLTSKPAWNIIGAQNQPTFGANWTNNGAGRSVGAFYKGIDGTVHLKGDILATANQAGGGTVTIFTLPSGFRPLEIREFVCRGWTGAAETFYTAWVTASGAVQPLSAIPNGAEIALDTFHFLAEQ